MALTDKLLTLFLEYAKDADKWDGTPLIGGNVRCTHADKGNLTDLKKAGLISTMADRHDIFLSFTTAGIALAADYGIDLCWA